MSTPTIKVKVFPRPVIKAKMDVRFPGRVDVLSPILLDKTGGNYTFGFDLNALGLDGVYQPLDSDLTAIAALTTTSYGRAFLALADAAAARTAVGLGNVDNTSDATKNAAAATLTNKTLTAPDINGGTVDNITSLGIRSSGAAFDLQMASAEVFTGNRVLSWVLGNAARTITVTANASIGGTNTGDQTITLTGDITGTGTASFATTIGANKVSLGMMAQIATATFLGRTTASTGNVEALTVAQATALLNAMAGDSGSGGTKGLVPAPAAGDAAANKVLGAGGAWVTQSGGGGTAATQAEQEAGTSTAVFTSPGRQKFHPSAAKAWVKWTSVTTTAINASYNVSSLTDNGVGKTTVNFTTAFSSGDYVPVATCSWATGDGASVGIEVDGSTVPTTTTCGFVMLNTVGTLFDRAGQYAAFYGDQ